MGSSGHTTGRGGHVTEALTYVPSTHVSLPTFQPLHIQEPTQNTKYGSIWTHLGAPLNRRSDKVRMRCALGHCSPPFPRIGAIHGVPDASCDFCFDTSHQKLHRMTLIQSPVSSRELDKSGFFLTTSNLWVQRLRRLQRPRKRAPAVCTTRALQSCVWRRWNRSEPARGRYGGY